MNGWYWFILAVYFIISISYGWFLLALGLFFFGCAYYIYIFYKPHPAEKFLTAYKKGDLSRKETVQKVANTMYDRNRDGIPSKWESELIRKRVEALKKRVSAENELMEEVIKFIKTKSRFD